MNKTSALLDVTRTYQVTDSTPLSSLVTAQEPPVHDETEKMKFLLHILNFRGPRRRRTGIQDVVKEIDF